MDVRPLRRDARRRLSDPAERPEWGGPKAVPISYGTAGLGSLRELLAGSARKTAADGQWHRTRVERGSVVATFGPPNPSAAVPVTGAVSVKRA